VLLGLFDEPLELQTLPHLVEESRED